MSSENVSKICVTVVLCVMWCFPVICLFFDTTGGIFPATAALVIAVPTLCLGVIYT